MGTVAAVAKVSFSAADVIAGARTTNSVAIAVVIAFMIVLITSCAREAGDIAWVGTALTFTMTGLVAGEGTADFLEFVHCHGGECLGVMVAGGVMVSLVDRDGGVDDFGLDDLLVDDWLNSLVHMMVDTLASNGRSNFLSVLRVVRDRGVSELGTLLLEPHPGLVGLVMFDVAVFDVTHPMLVLLWQDFFGLDRLDRGMVVILVCLLVHGSLHMFMTRWRYTLIGNSGSGLFIDSSMVVTSLAKEITNGSFSSIHFEIWFVDTIGKIEKLDC